MQESAEDARPDDPAVEEVEQPSPEAATQVDAAQEKDRQISRGDWREFMRVNARMLLTIALLGAGVVFVILGWYGAAHTNILTEQIPYLISGGLLGLGLIVVAGVMAAGAAQERSTDELRREIARTFAAMSSAAPDRGVAESLFSRNGQNVYVVPGGRSYHEPGCPILEGKEGVKELQPAQAAASGYAACKLCGAE